MGFRSLWSCSYIAGNDDNVKSDDVQGRAKMYETIVKGENMPNPNIPESFNVLVQ